MLRRIITCVQNRFTTDSHPTVEPHEDLVLRRVVRCSQMHEVKLLVRLLDDLTLEASQAILSHYQRTGGWVNSNDVISAEPPVLEGLPTYAVVKGRVPIKSFRAALRQAVKLAKDPETEVYNAIGEYILRKYRKTFAPMVVESGWHASNMPFHFELVGEIPVDAVIEKYEFVFDVDDVDLQEDEAVVEFTLVENATERNYLI